MNLREKKDMQCYTFMQTIQKTGCVYVSEWLVWVCCSWVTNEVLITRCVTMESGLRTSALGKSEEFFHINGDSWDGSGCGGQRPGNRQLYHV